MASSLTTWVAPQIMMTETKIMGKATRNSVLFLLQQVEYTAAKLLILVADFGRRCTCGKIGMRICVSTALPALWAI